MPSTIPVSSIGTAGPDLETPVLAEGALLQPGIGQRVGDRTEVDVVVQPVDVQRRALADVDLDRGPPVHVELAERRVLRHGDGGRQRGGDPRRVLQGGEVLVHVAAETQLPRQPPARSR